MTALPDPREIHSRSAFVEFVRKLNADLRSGGAAWENTDLSAYLDALAAWVESMDGSYRNTGQEPPREVTWSVLAQALAAASAYE